MIDCERALELETMYGYMDGRLEEGWMIVLEAHYRDCPECAGALSLERRIQTFVRDRSHVVVPESLYRKTARILDNA